MHFGDKEQLDNNIVELVVYKHQDLSNEKEYYFGIESIRKCQYICPSHFIKLLMCFEYMFKKEIDELDLDVFYVVQLKSIDGYGEFVIVSIERSSEDNDLDKLH